MSTFAHCSGCCINAGMHHARARRERIAAAVLAGIMANSGTRLDLWDEKQRAEVGDGAVRLADALIAALDATPARGGVMATDLIGDEVLAELTAGIPGVSDDIERAAWLRPECASDTGVRIILRRLALTRRQVREAEAREREACAVIAENYPRPHANQYQSEIARLIRAQGGTGNG